MVMDENIMDIVERDEISALDKFPNQVSYFLAKHKAFPFLDLPPEIRNQIYHDCLVSDEIDSQGYPSLHFAATRGRYRHIVIRCSEKVENHKAINTSLLIICKAIHAEAAPLLYHHRFIFHDNFALIAFMSGCASQAAQLIKYICVHNWLHERRSQKNLGFLAMFILAAKGCVNLESLKVNGSLGHFDVKSEVITRKIFPIQERVAAIVYREFHPWLEAVGRASGETCKGLDVLDIGNATWNYTATNRTPDDDKDREEERTSLKAAYIASLKLLMREHWT